MRNLSPGERLLTAEEYARLPEDDRCRSELVRGRVVREPRPRWGHLTAQSQLHARLASFVERHGLGFAGVEGGFLLEQNPDSVRGPDVMFIRRERLGETHPERWPEFGPDLVVEILSPSNRPRAMAEKLAQYFGAGTRLAWVIDPKKRTARIYRPGREARVLRAQDDLDGEDVVPGFRLRLADILDTPKLRG